MIKSSILLIWEGMGQVLFTKDLFQEKAQRHEGGPKVNQKILTSIKVRPNCMSEVQMKINQLLKLDPNVVEPLLDAFYMDDTVMVVNPYHHQGHYNLYRLAHVRQQFSELMIAQIAKQLLTQLNHLHGHGIYMKHLNPQHIHCTQGFSLHDPQIKV